MHTAESAHARTLMACWRARREEKLRETVGLRERSRSRDPVLLPRRCALPSVTDILLLLCCCYCCCCGWCVLLGDGFLLLLLLFESKGCVERDTAARSSGGAAHVAPGTECGGAVSAAP